MQVHREAYVAAMTGAPVERPLFCELFGPLIGLEDEWRAQGATEEEIALTAFGFDWVPIHNVGVNTGLRGGAEPALLEETDEYVIRRDVFGRRVKLCKASATIPLPLDHPVTDMESWRAVKPWFEYSDERFGDGWAEAARAAREAGALVKVGIPGGFDLPRQLFGEEALCLAYYEQPGVIEEILATVGDTAERVLDRVTREVQVDQLSVHEDMAGKSGSLVGPAQIEAFIAPYYRRIWDLLQSRGVRLFDQDSDGNMNSVLDAFVDAGLNAFHPCEPAANMDLVHLKREYGNRLGIRCGIDKHVLRQSPDAVRKELEYKLQPNLHTGVVFGLAHRIPNGTPLEHYRYYVRTARELLGLDPNPEPGWARMAF